MLFKTFIKVLISLRNKHLFVLKFYILNTKNNIPLKVKKWVCDYIFIVLVREAEAILDANTVGPRKYIESYKKYNNILSSQVIFLMETSRIQQIYDCTQKTL